MVNYKKFQNKKGFTLIEVMVSASILALLAAIIFANLNQGRVKAAEVKAIQEAKSLQTATELYRSDNGQYPASKGTKDDLSNLETALVPKYIPEIPTGPDISTYSDFCPNIPKIKYISNGSVAEDDNYQYRCGPGNTPSGAVTLILTKKRSTDVSIEVQPHARLKGNTGSFNQLVVAVWTPLVFCSEGATCNPEPQCSETMIPPGAILIDSSPFAFVCLSQ